MPLGFLFSHGESKSFAAAGTKRFRPQVKCNARRMRKYCRSARPVLKRLRHRL